MIYQVTVNHMSANRSRRHLLKACAVCGVAFAGCLGDGDGDDGTGDGGDDGSDGDPAADFPDFDPLDRETWYPQLTSTYLEHGFETGSIDELELFEERDEPVYGDPPEETPEDESEWIDPDPIDFSLVPTEDPALYEDTLEPLLDNMAEETGREINYVGLDSYAAQVEAMRAERLHVAGFSTGTVPFAVNLANAVPFGIQVGEESFGYRLWVITHIDNDHIQELEDLGNDDVSVAHTEPSSNSGHLAPNAMFTEHGVTPGEDYEIEFSGGHDNSATAIFHKDIDVGPICSTCYARAQEQENIDAAKIKSIWASSPFPTTAFCYRNNVHPDVQQGVMNAFLDYDYQDTEIAEEFEGRGTWVEIDYATHWHDILVNHQVNGVTYEEEEL